MNKDFGKVLGSLISAMTGMNVEVEPKPAAFIPHQSVTLMLLQLIAAEHRRVDIQKRLRAATRPATNPGFPTATTPSSYGPVDGAAAGRSTIVTPTLCSL